MIQKILSKKKDLIIVSIPLIVFLIASIEYLLACCIVMKLPPWDSDMLFELAGIVLRPNNKKERCYIALLHVFFKEGSISVCDEVLTTMGLPSLSSIINSNKKNK